VQDPLEQGQERHAPAGQESQQGDRPVRHQVRQKKQVLSGTKKSGAIKYVK
jgi:hypothetical protein